MKSSDIRDQFLQFFKHKQHQIVAASPIVLHNDPTLLFVNAGMNQFKDVFLGEGDRTYTRCVNSQPCIRVSGKHNDLEEVGQDTYHLTSFEMLGNWSFGDFYKKEIIPWAWEFVTEVLNIPKDTIYATVFETDAESESLWISSTDIDPKKVLRFGKKDNYWEMGDVGPCGPCSELHVDRGPTACDKQETDHVCQVNGECARYIELWNLVFIQSERCSDGSLKPLPATHVDTGAGLERLTAYKQGVNSIYDTDLFVPIIKKIEALTGIPYKDTHDGMPFRVIADHIRTLVFAISDNVMPSNEGRGYVLRRLLRRAMRYARQLGVKTPLLYAIVPTVLDVMGHAYPKLTQRLTLITDVIQAEENSFIRTLDAGLVMLEKELNATKDVLSGEQAFTLYDTYGFPIDLTALIANEQNITIDMDGFNAALQAQKDQSRQNQKKGAAVSVDYQASEFGDQRIETDDLIYCTTKSGLKGGEAIAAQSDLDRLLLARHHTATHLLQWALRKVLGDHVFQAGSYVDCERLRFDFSHFKALTSDELASVSTLINESIQSQEQVTATYMPLEEAKQSGVMALFGEVYPDDVRVITIGSGSRELCGGNHVKNTSLIEAFKLISETGIAAGTRRIEAIVGQANIQHYQDQINEKNKQEIQKISIEIEALTGKKPTISDVNAAKELLKKARKNQLQQQHQQASQNSDDILQTAEPIPNSKQSLLVYSTDLFSVSQLKVLGDNLTHKQPELIAVLYTYNESNATVVVKLGSQLTSNELTATAIVNQLTQIAGGKGGGKNHFAQAGGLDLKKMDEAINHLRSQLCVS